jgi:hypothetical protein
MSTIVLTFVTVLIASAAIAEPGRFKVAQSSCIVDCEKEFTKCVDQYSGTSNVVKICRDGRHGM